MVRIRRRRCRDPPQASQLGQTTKIWNRGGTTVTKTTVDTSASVELVDTYIEMWRAPDESKRTELLRRLFVADGRHADPLADVAGHEALAGMLAKVHTAYPGFSIERTSGVDRHGDHLRFTWQLNAADGTPVVTGLDVAELATDGRFARVISFWGDLPGR
jgi:hypothetical protein